MKVATNTSFLFLVIHFLLVIQFLLKLPHRENVQHDDQHAHDSQQPRMVHQQTVMVAGLHLSKRQRGTYSSWSSPATTLLDGAIHTQEIKDGEETGPSNERDQETILRQEGIARTDKPAGENGFLCIECDDAVHTNIAGSLSSLIRTMNREKRATH